MQSCECVLVFFPARLLLLFTQPPLWGSLATLLTSADAVKSLRLLQFILTNHASRVLLRLAWVDRDNNCSVLLLSAGVCTLFRNVKTLPLCSLPPLTLSLSLSCCFLSADVLLLSPLTGRCESVNGLPWRGIDTDPKPWVSRPVQPEPALGAHVRRQPREWPHVSPHQLYLKGFFHLN